MSCNMSLRRSFQRYATTVKKVRKKSSYLEGEIIESTFDKFTLVIERNSEECACMMKTNIVTRNQASITSMYIHILFHRYFSSRFTSTHEAYDFDTEFPFDVPSSASFSMTSTSAAPSLSFSSPPLTASPDFPKHSSLNFTCSSTVLNAVEKVNLSSNAFSSSSIRVDLSFLR